MSRIFVALGAAIALGVSVQAQAGPYVSGGTAVYRAEGQTQVDDGGAVCSLATGAGIGGGCIPFGTANSLAVSDLVAGSSIAFQVCIDNNGDGKCTDFGQAPDGAGCSDQVYFSHSDSGAFHNPLGPLPTGYAPGCSPATGFPGWVVFVCEGVHTVGGSTHVHPATTGSITATGGGTGYGNFCGANGERGSTQVVEKDYALV